jgi:hypothetical protein
MVMELLKFMELLKNFPWWNTFWIAVPIFGLLAVYGPAPSGTR